MTQKFTDRYGNTFKVDVKNHLIKFLNPTSRGTKYYDVPPDKNITKIQYGRILLQIHQILHLFKSLNVSLKNKKVFRYRNWKWNDPKNNFINNTH